LTGDPTTYFEIIYFATFQYSPDVAEIFYTDEELQTEYEVLTHIFKILELHNSYYS
jgi:hypothetical protein